MQKKWEEEKEVIDFVKQHGTSSSEEDKAEKTRNKEQKLYLKLERKAKERYWYNLKSLIIHGNGLLSLLLINSFLMPRHVRFTMFFTNILLNFFWCALIYSNSRSELLLPESVSYYQSILYSLGFNESHSHCSKRPLHRSYCTIWHNDCHVCVCRSLQDFGCSSR
jgi:hypothetical protein